MKKGFTLLEMMLCIAVISILTLLFLWNKTNNPVEKSKIVTIQANLQTVKQKILEEKIETNTYPVKEKILFKNLSVGLQRSIQEFSKEENIPLDDVKDTLYKINEKKIKQSALRQDILNFVVFLGEEKNALFYDGKMEGKNFYTVMNDGTSNVKKREFTFAGHQWYAIESVGAKGPGPNDFSNDSKSVWLDERGRLHLKMRYENGRWYGAEIRSKETFGYGTYRFNVDSNFYNYDENVVLQLSTYDDSSEEDSFKQIGVTFAKWGRTTREVANYTVQPDAPYTFDTKMGGSYSTHMVKWEPNDILFTSYYGNYTTTPTPDLWMKEWKYTGSNVPKTGAEKVYINLWMWQGKPPKNGQEVEVTIIDFGFEQK